jgi:hypothetical protein
MAATATRDWTWTKHRILAVVVLVAGVAALVVGKSLVAVLVLFRCSICGTEVRMTSANDEVPEPPRHCQEDMDLVAPPIE